MENEKNTQKNFKLKRKAKKNYNKLKTKKRHLGFFSKEVLCCVACALLKALVNNVF